MYEPVDIERVLWSQVHLLQLSSLSPDLERLNELAYRLPLSDRDMKRLQGLNRTWASHSAHLTERFRYGMALTGHLSVTLHVNVRRAP